MLANICFGPESANSWLMAGDVLEVYRLIISEMTLYRKTFLNMVYIIANLAGNSLEARDLLISHPMFEIFLARLPSHAVLDTFRELSWVIRLLLRGDSSPSSFPPIDIGKQLVMIASKIFNYTNDLETLYEAGWAIYFFLSCDFDQIERREFIVEQSIFLHLSKCLFEFNYPVRAIAPLVHILEKMSEGPEEIVERVFNEETDIEVSLCLAGITPHGSGECGEHPAGIIDNLQEFDFKQ